MARIRSLLRSFPALVALVGPAPLALALGACSGVEGPGGPGDDPRGVNERVRALAQRFTYGNAGPYATPAVDGGRALPPPSGGGPFENADSSGAPRSSAIGGGGVYERASTCETLCSVVAGCFAVDVPANCSASCTAQLRDAAREYGEACAEPLLGFYACVAGALVCSRPEGRGGGEVEGDDDDADDDDGDALNEDIGLDFDPDGVARCLESVSGLGACLSQPEPEPEPELGPMPMPMPAQ